MFFYSGLDEQDGVKANRPEMPCVHSYIHHVRLDFPKPMDMTDDVEHMRHSLGWVVVHMHPDIISDLQLAGVEHHVVERLLQ